MEPLKPKGSGSVSEPTEMLRLLVATPGYCPYYSGAAERFRRYLPGFKTRGIDVSVFTGTPTAQKATGAESEARWADMTIGALLPPELVDGVPVHRIRLPHEGGFRRAGRFARGVRQFCGEPGSAPDVVQMFTPAIAAVPDLWRLRRMGIPTIATRTMMPIVPSSRFMRAIRRVSVRTASEVIACEVVGSRAMLEAFRGAGVRNRIEVIPHGVDLERFHPVAGPAERLLVRQRLGMPDRAFVLLYAGSITRRKGVHRLLEAWHSLAPGHPDVHLVIAGPRPENRLAVDEAYNQTLQRLIAGSGAPERVHFPGLVPGIELFMRAADLVLLPSSREGMPNVVGEAMASGVPVVTTPFDGLSSEFGEAGVHYVLTRFDPTAIASDIASLLGAPERRAEIGNRGRDWVERHLTMALSIDRYAGLYHELATGRHNRWPR
jgi:glycosyltransferase involved in cell wall biosynthesis